MAINMLDGLARPRPLMNKAARIQAAGNAPRQAQFAANHPRAAKRAGIAPRPNVAPQGNAWGNPNITPQAKQQMAGQAMDALGLQSPAAAQPQDFQPPQPSSWRERMQALPQPSFQQRLTPQPTVGSRYSGGIQGPMMPQQYGQPNPGAAQMSQQIAQSLKQQPIQSDIRKPLAGQDPTQEQYNG